MFHCPMLQCSKIARIDGNIRAVDIGPHSRFCLDIYCSIVPLLECSKIKSPESGFLFFGGPPETRTTDPLIKSASPNGPQPRHYQNSQAFQRNPSFCLGGVGIRLHQDTDKRRTFSRGDTFPSIPACRPSLTAYKKGRGHSNEKAIPLTVNQKGQFKGLKPQTFFSSVRELSVSLNHTDLNENGR